MLFMANKKETALRRDKFLPVNIKDMTERGIEQLDCIIVTGDAYVDHPSFGTAIISRIIEAQGYTVGIIAQPNWKTAEDFTSLGRPRLGFFVNSGNIDSMVAHYTTAKKWRSDDSYSPGGKGGKRPDRAVIVYCNRIREAYGDIPIIIGGIEASLRRFAHYDYWDDKVRASILQDSSADILVYGMGEAQTKEILYRLNNYESLSGINGTCTMENEPPAGKNIVYCSPFEAVKTDKKAYASACKIQIEEQDPIRGKTIVQPHGKRYLVQNPPAMPLTQSELDEVYSLPYARAWHPMYDALGGIPALKEVEFSITSCRGCFGGCNFCSLTFHQGRIVTSRSHKSIIDEAKLLAKKIDFKGYIHDVGGPTANFRHPACKKQCETGTCKNKACLAPEACSQLDADHSDYISLLAKLRNISGIKKVFIRSGIRFDYMMEDKNEEFFYDLCRFHISGQLKVAPEHCSDRVLRLMGKPSFSVYRKFYDKYYRINSKLKKDQYLVPYFMSSHPGSRIEDAIELALYLKEIGYAPQQVQDFYPTPGTISTCMFYTGLNPLTGESVYVPKTQNEKAMQRALLQYRKPENRKLVIEALKKAGRNDLIGFDKKCLVRPFEGMGAARKERPKSINKSKNNKRLK
jgi:uncharacterized radical SAM protein YgiQ